MKFKSDSNTELIKQGELISGNVPIMLKFTPEERGQYLIEIQDTNSKGHKAAIFMNASPWGRSPDFENGTS